MKQRFQHSNNMKILCKFLIDSKESYNEIFIWEVLDERVIKVPLKLKKISINERLIILLLKNLENKKDFHSIFTGRLKIKIYLPHKFMYWEAEIEKYQLDNELILKFPEEFFYLNRRTEERIDLDKENKSKLKISFVRNNKNLPVSPRDLKDLSLSGCSLYITEDEKSKFKVGLKYNNAVIIVNNELININVIIANLIKKDAYSDHKILYSAWKVGLKFIELEKNSLAKIENIFYSLITR
jgi:hypothetical protein